VSDAPELLVVGAAILRGATCLVGQRPRGGSFGERWEFPGGKVEGGETPEQALQREIGEELGVAIAELEWAGQGHVLAGGRHIVLDVYFASLAAGEPRAHVHIELRWIRASEIERLAWADADLPILPALRARLLERESEQSSAGWAQELHQK